MLDAETGAVRASTTAAGDGAGVSWSRRQGRVWLADTAKHLVGRIDAVEASAAEQIPIPRVRADPIAAGAKDFPGLANAGRQRVGGRQLGRAHPLADRGAVGRVAATIPLGFAPKAVAAGEGGVWVTSLLGDTVSRIDPATNRIVATIRSAQAPTRLPREAAPSG